MRGHGWSAQWRTGGRGVTVLRGGERFFKPYDGVHVLDLGPGVERSRSSWRVVERPAIPDRPFHAVMQVLCGEP